MYQEFSTSVQVPAGATTVYYDVGPSGGTRKWTVSQVSISMPTAPLGSACEMTRDGMFVTSLIPTGDVAGSGPPILLQGSQKLRIRWTGVTAGAVGTIFGIYDDGREGA